MPFPAVPGKHAGPGAHRPGTFLDALRADGWEPGPVPESVVFTYARFELYLAAHPELYTPNHRSMEEFLADTRQFHDGAP